MRRLTRTIFLCPLFVLPVLAACKKVNSVETGDADTLSWNSGDPHSWSDPERGAGDAIAVIDGSGEEGSSGSSGQRGFDGMSGYGLGSRGQNGRDGSDGSDGRDATDAGSISVGIGYESGGKQFHIRGSVTGGRNGSSQINKVYSVDQSGYILLRANGGAGGKGGDGGIGGSGGRGADGTNGSSSGRGNDGERGGDGGRGGRGGNGGDGGNAGKVSVRVKDSESELLWMLRAQVAGGPGGEAGDGGSGGSGGSGGMSGSSYCWTEGSGESARENCNSGGSAGYSGSSGYAGSDGYSGRAGTDGLAEIEVVSGSGSSKRYTRMFELGLRELHLEEQFKDGIFEPGEKIAVRKIKFSNSGGMPTPSKPSALSLWEQGSISGPSTPLRVEMPGALAPNAVFERSFAANKYIFRLKNQSDSGDVFGFSPAVKFGSKVRMLGGGREFPISSPIVTSMEPSQARYFVTRGREQKFTFEISNQSTAAYGLSGGGVKRAVRVRLSLAGSSIPPAKRSLSIVGKKTALDSPIEFDIPALAAKSTRKETITVTIDPTVPVDQTFVVKAEVLLSPEPGQPPTKVVSSERIEFLSSLDPTLELSLAAKVKDFHVRCRLMNPDRERRIDEIWITKSKGSRNVALKFDTTMWWLWNDSPSYVVDLNQIAPFIAKVQKSQPLDATSVRNIFRTIIIPASRKLQGGTPWEIVSCDIKECNLFSGCKKPK